MLFAIPVLPLRTLRVHPWLFSCVPAGNLSSFIDRRVCRADPSLRLRHEASLRKTRLGHGGSGCFSACLLAFADDGDFLQNHRLKGAVVAVAFYSGDGADDEEAGGVALAEDGVVAIERLSLCHGDEELAAVGVGSGVGHGQAAGAVEGQAGIELIFELEAGAAVSGAGGVAALNHVSGDDAMEDGSVVERAVMHLGAGDGIGPVLFAFSEGGEMRDCFGDLLAEQVAGDASDGGVHDNGGAAGSDRCVGGLLGDGGQK